MASNTNSPTTKPKQPFNADAKQPKTLSPEDYIAICRHGGLITYHPITSIPYVSQSNFNLPTLSAVLTACQSINRHPGMSNGGEEISFRTLFVKNLEENHTKRDLFTLFGPYGKIITYRIILNKVGRVYGFVTFLNPDSALAALMDLNGKLVGNGRLIVEPARLQWPQNIWQKLPKTPYKRSIHYKRKSQYDTKVI